MRLILVALCAGLLCPIANADADPDDVIIDPIFDALAESIVDQQAPGFALLAVKGGEVLHRQTYGHSSLQSLGKVTLHTPFYIASVAKMFTAAAVLALVEDNRVKLADPIGQHLDVVPAYAGKVTVEQLLTHTSGLPDYYDFGGEERNYSNRDVLLFLQEMTALEFEPGSRASYSNSGYVLLALLVEQVSGQSFGRYLQQRFFAPLGMTDTVIADGAGEQRADRALGYRRTPEGFVLHDYASTTTGPGGIYASLADLERWHRGLRDRRVLSDASLKLASRPPALPGGRLTPYGMGWLAEFAGRGPLKDKWYVAAFGSLRGFRALFQWYQDDDLLLVWLANSDSDDILDLLHGMPERLLAPGGNAHAPATPDIPDQ